MTARSTPRQAWLVGPWFDSACIAWAWVPFYVFVVFGLGLDGDWSGPKAQQSDALGLAMLVALGVSYIHRHYTFLLVYGDGETFRQRRLAYALVPVGVLIALSILMQFDTRITVFGLKMRPWMLALIVTGAWNMWHTIMQRHGINRIYAGKAGGGLQARAHSRRDLALLWSAVGLTAVVTVMFRAETFAGIGNARKTLKVAAPLVEGPVGWIALAIVASVFLQVAYGWMVFEREADVDARARIPRINFLGSTATLLLVFVLHGPIVGYLCFGVAHAVEYVFFFHVFGRKKFANRSPETIGVAGWILARPWISGPAIALALTGLFLLLVDHRRNEVYMVYYTTTSLLHFLYDGWIWKVRKPEVAAPLELAQPDTLAP